MTVGRTIKNIRGSSIHKNGAKLRVARGILRKKRAFSRKNGHVLKTEKMQ